MREYKKRTEFEKNLRAWETAKCRLENEISFFWQRGVYFWTFTAAAYYALFSMKENSNFEKSIIMLVGYTVSLLWYLSMRGSRKWQLVWEKKVMNLEELVSRINYKDNSFCDKNEGFIIGAKSYSVSRIAILVSLIFCISWFLVIIDFSFSFHTHPIWISVDSKYGVMSFIISAIFTILAPMRLESK